MFAAAPIHVVLAESPARPPVVGREAPLTTVRPSSIRWSRSFRLQHPPPPFACRFSYRSGIRITRRRVQHDKASLSLLRVTYQQTSSNGTSDSGTCYSTSPGPNRLRTPRNGLPSSRFCASLSFTTVLPTIAHQPVKRVTAKIVSEQLQPRTDASGGLHTINDTIDFLLISIHRFRPLPFPSNYV